MTKSQSESQRLDILRSTKEYKDWKKAHDAKLEDLLRIQDEYM